MSFSRILLTALCGLTFLFAVGADAQQPAADAAAKPARPGVYELREQANAAYRKEDYAAFRDAIAELHERRPYNGDYMSLLVVANALLGDRSGAYSTMLKMQQQGLAHDFNQSTETESIRGTEAYEYINDLLVQAAEPAGQAQLLFELPADLLLPTSMAWDASRAAYLVGDAREGAIHSVDSDGNVSKLLISNDENGLWAIFGLAVDAANNRLWVSSSASETHTGYDPIDAGRAALFEFELDTLEPVKRYPVPVDGRPHRLGSLVLTPAGDIYAVDTVLPVIYKLAVGADRLQPYMASADMVSMRGATLSDRNILYVADYEMGIMGVDLVNNQAFELAAPSTLNLGGIEGLFFKDGSLVMIQNGIQPQRIMSLKLDTAGMVVEDFAPLAVAQPFFDYPNFGALHDDSLVFLANSHWVADQQEPAPIRVAKTDISETSNLATNKDLMNVIDEFQRQGGIAPVNPVPGTARPDKKD